MVSAKAIGYTLTLDHTLYHSLLSSLKRLRIATTKRVELLCRGGSFLDRKLAFVEYKAGVCLRIDQLATLTRLLISYRVCRCCRVARRQGFSEAFSTASSFLLGRAT